MQEKGVQGKGVGTVIKISIGSSHVSSQVENSINQSRDQDQNPSQKRKQKQQKQQQQPPLTAIQIMGPNDEYLVQANTDITKFWAYENCQAFGCIFDEHNHANASDKNNNNNDNDNDNDNDKPAKDPNNFLKTINTGYQVLPTKMQGKVYGHDGSLGGVFDNQGIYGTCEFDIDITPLSGWGDDDDDDDNDGDGDGDDDGDNNDDDHVQQQHDHHSDIQNNKHQKSTAGWLASYSIFEPHWQITIADAKANGYINWNGTLYELNNAPLYSEKNWGSSFPTKWYWIQCNSFIGYGNDNDNDNDNKKRLSLTAGGGKRKVSLLNGLISKEEDLGLVGIHHNGIFYENVPWTGTMEWDIDIWGKWNFNGKCTTGKRLFEVVVNATCDDDAGVMLRVPTKEYGLEYMCRDTFEGSVSLSLYELVYCRDVNDYVRRDDVPPIIDNAISHSCAVEVGGGPWSSPWKSKSKMNRILKFLVKIPYLIN